MSDKPSYLGLLNAVSLAETAAHEYLTAWAAVTPHEGVKATLLTVAAREGEHGMSFAKRINELGYNLRPGPDDPKRAERLAVACSTEISDYDKMHALGVARIAEEPRRAARTSSTSSSPTTPSTFRPASCWVATSPRSGTAVDGFGRATSP